MCGTHLQIAVFLVFVLQQFTCQIITNDGVIIQSNRKTANTCITNANCTSNAFCEFGQCICQEGFFIVEENRLKTCHKVATKIGEPCVHREACQISFGTEADCINSTCRCKPNSHFDGGTCYKNALIGEYCKVSSNCLGNDTVCRSGRCQCPFSSHTNANRTSCHKTTYLGEPCSMNEECITENSMCFETCICRAGYIMNLEKNGCLKIASKLYDSCNIDDQCLTTIGCSKCDENNTCVCAKGYHDVNYKCVSSTLLGFRCDRSENCITPNAECKFGICACKEGFKKFHGQCSSSPNKNMQFLYILLLVPIRFYLESFYT
ncbi:prion-like-(Q/N-rich) domain-bearing protein 25 [Culicoides brevitarsis]|uniref:prion-like-(Q/N-rich) domain-bearing protein 25 n=1 Tax=Culicoides brevitarsis TaxID=469753 RepID=UPI00307C02CF